MPETLIENRYAGLFINNYPRPQIKTRMAFRDGMSLRWAGSELALSRAVLQGAVRAVVRAVPIAILQPLIGTSEAVARSLMGTDVSSAVASGCFVFVEDWFFSFLHKLYSKPSLSESWASRKSIVVSSTYHAHD